MLASMRGKGALPTLRPDMLAVGIRSLRTELDSNIGSLGNFLKSVTVGGTATGSNSGAPVGGVNLR